MSAKKAMTTRLDAAEGAFFERELESIEAQIHRHEMPEIKHERLIPTVSGFDPGAAKVLYRMIQSIGRARVLYDKTMRIPRVDIEGTEHAQGVKPIAAAFGYSVYEIKAAAKAQVALEAERALTADESIKRELEEIAFLGHAQAGLNGLLNNAAVAATVAITGGGGVTWDLKTPDEIVADMNLAVDKVRTQTNGVESPDTMVLPEDKYTQIAQTRMSGNTDKTILQFWLSSSPWIKNVEPLHFCSTAGTGSTRLLMAYRRDPTKLQLKNPHGLERMEPEKQGLEYETIMHMTTAGLIYRKPKSAHYVYGI